MLKVHFKYSTISKSVIKEYCDIKLNITLLNYLLGYITNFQKYHKTARCLLEKITWDISI